MEATFDWRSLGKADYSQAAALVASLPEETRCKMDGIDREILTRIVHLSWTYSERSGRGAGYCWPTLSTLGRYVQRSARTVGRHLVRLASLGLIEQTHRLTKDRAWTSNLYQAGKIFLASLFARRNRKSPIKTPRTFLSYNNLKKGYKADATWGLASKPVTVDVKETPVTDSPLGAESRNRLRQLIEQFGSKVTSGSPDAWDEPEPVGEVVESVADRKARLREQARALLERGL